MLRGAVFCLLMGVVGAVTADEAGVVALTVTDTRLGFRGFSITVEDSGAPFSAKLILELRGLGCSHPDARDLMVDLGYSERSPNGGITESFAAEGEQLMKSLRFGPVVEWDRAEEVSRSFD